MLEKDGKKRPGLLELAKDEWLNEGAEKNLEDVLKDMGIEEEKDVPD